MSDLGSVETITLFVDDIADAKAFYKRVFDAAVIYEDAVSYVMKFEGVMINLLQSSSAPELVAPEPVAPTHTGSRMLLTIKVPDVDAVCALLRGRGVTMLNGPVDRPWGRRTAAFADPSGHVWEVAHELR
jgi:catechol 2,3-dioxygenase-like lactoylglutathione lyase family enzyme